MRSRLLYVFTLLSLIVVVVPGTALAGSQGPRSASHPGSVPYLARTELGLDGLSRLAQSDTLLQAGPGAVITVTTFDPVIAADGQCSLIEAMVNANDDTASHPDCPAGSGADTIELMTGTYTLTAIDNSANGDNGLPAVTSTITINGRGATVARSSAIDTPAFRIFYVAAEGNLTLNDLTVSNGAASPSTNGGGIRNQGGVLTLNNCIIRNNTTNGFPGRGAGIYNLQGLLTATGTSVHSNLAVTGGGGIWNSSGSVVLNDCTIRENTARSTEAYEAIGGGLFNSAGVSNSTMTLNHTVVISNTADGPESGGGGIGNSSVSGTAGILTLNDSTVAGNEAAYGAGLWITISTGPSPDTQALVNRSTISGNVATGQGSGFSDGAGIENFAATTTVVNSTVSGNAAIGSQVGNGGGISNQSDVGYPAATLHLINSTVASNSGSTEGGGVGTILYTPGASAVTTFVNTIVANNTAPQGANCWGGGGALTSLGYNMEDVDTCNFGEPTDHSNTDPLLGPLADNGGLTETQALLKDSPAINAGDSSTCVAAPVSGVDQRGVVRPQGPACDIGAFEALSHPAVPGAVNPVRVPASAGWVNTGIVVRANVPVALTTLGKASTGPFNNSRATHNGPDGSTHPCNPDGTSEPCALDGAMYGALVGRIGEYGVPFLVGSADTVRSESNGVLYLAVNDNLIYYADNQGGFTELFDR